MINQIETLDLNHIGYKLSVANRQKKESRISCRSSIKMSKLSSGSTKYW